MVRLMEWEKKITVTDSYICLLIRQGFTASETAILLGMKPQALSNRKKRILIKITGKEENELLINLKRSEIEGILRGCGFEKEK